MTPHEQSLLALDEIQKTLSETSESTLTESQARCVRMFIADAIRLERDRARRFAQDAHNKIMHGDLN